jgi:adenosine deaminase CECR1
VFEDQTEEQWLKDIQVGSDGASLKANRMQQWASEWEAFCKWVVAEFEEV